jgi:hypothetical protein
MRRVIVESPYAAPKGVSLLGQRLVVARNVRYARACLRDCFDRGEAPFASHAFYTLVLDDNVPDERATGMAAGWAWTEVADLVAVYIDLGMSKGMFAGIDRAESVKKPVETRTLGFDWSECQGRTRSLKMCKPGAPAGPDHGYECPQWRFVEAAT